MYSVCMYYIVCDEVYVCIVCVCTVVCGVLCDVVL